MIFKHLWYSRATKMFISFALNIRAQTSYSIAITNIVSSLKLTYFHFISTKISHYLFVLQTFKSIIFTIVFISDY